jgi:hypothetical protein
VNDELPWANEALESGEVEAGDASPILELKKGSKGYLVVTEHYKAFLFGGSEIYGFVIEALETWKVHKEIPYRVVSVVRKTGKISIGVDEDFSSTVYVDKKGNVSFKPPHGDSPLESNPSPTNPFLSPLTSSVSEASVSTRGTGRKKPPL